MHGLKGLRGEPGHKGDRGPLGLPVSTRQPCSLGSSYFIPTYFDSTSSNHYHIHNCPFVCFHCFDSRSQPSLLCCPLNFVCWIIVHLFMFVTQMLTVFFFPSDCSSCTNITFQTSTHTSINAQGASGLDGKPGPRVSLKRPCFAPRRAILYIL